MHPRKDRIFTGVSGIDTEPVAYGRPNFSLELAAPGFGPGLKPLGQS